MGSQFSSNKYHPEEFENPYPIHQDYAVRFGLVPMGPVGALYSKPKRHLHGYHSPRRQRIWY